MNWIMAFLNIIAPDFVEGGWHDPLQVVSFGLALIITPLALWGFFGGFARLLDHLTDKALDLIPSPPPLTDRQEKEIQRSRSRIINQADPSWAKPVAIMLGLLILIPISAAIVSADWLSTSNPLLWIAAIFAALIFTAEVGAKIDRAGWKAQALAVLALIVVVYGTVNWWVRQAGI